MLDALLANEEDIALSERSFDEAESSNDSDYFSVDDLTSANRSTETSGNESEVKPSSAEMRGPMIEGDTPADNRMPLCSKFFIPIDNKNTVDRLLNELNSLKKESGGREFTTYNENITKKVSNHCVETPIGSSEPTTRALKKCVTSIIRKGSSEPEMQIRASKVIKSL